MNEDLIKIMNERERVPAKKSKYCRRVQGFIDFLSKIGKVEVSLYSETIVNKGIRKGKDYVEAERIGVFVNKNLIGILDFYSDEFWYKGEVPGAISHLDEEVVCLGKKVYHNAPLVTMIYRINDNEREDGWDVNFPN